MIKLNEIVLLDMKLNNNQYFVILKPIEKIY